MKRRPPMRRRLGDYFARVLSGRSAKRPTFEPMGLRRLRTEPLEDRRMLSVGTSYVDDTLAITNDIGDPGLSPGDTVTYAAGEAGEQTGLIYGTDAFDSIQDAVDATDTGGTVNVATGLYAEGVTVGKNLTFDGATGTASDVVIQPISGDGFTLASNQVTIRDLKITGAYNAIAGDGANGASALSLDNVELVDNLHDGVTLSNAGSFDATDLVVTGNDGYGCDLSFLTGDVTLTRVTIDGNDDGLRIWDFGSVTISDSSISDNEYQGIQIDYGAGDAVLSNVTANNNRSDNASVDVTGSVTITNGSFNGSVYFDGGGMVDGGGDGLDITSDAGVTLVNVTAYGNYGQNLEIGAEGSVYITNGSFDNSYNYGGIEIDTSYANTTSEVVLTNVTANDNWGQNLRISGGISVLIDGGSFDNSTDYGGVIVQVYGDVTMIDVSADGNYDENLSVWYASSLTVTNGSFNASIRDEGLKLCGIDGNVTLTNVVSNGSYDQNLVLDPLENILFDPITGEPLFDPETGEFIIVLVQADSVTITDSSFNGSLTDEGIQIEGVEGALTLTNVTSNGNNDEAAEITMAGSVIVNGGSFSDSTTLPGIVLNSVTTGLISGAAIENNPIGIYVGPGSATAIVGNSIVGTGLSTAIDVESGTAMIEGNDLGGNMIGLLVRSDGTTPAVVDAGQLAGGTDFTGLGISTGGNDFSAYTTSDALSGAVVNLNADTLAGPQGAPTDVTALGNTWYSADPLQIEAAIYHDPDDVSGLIAYVDYAVLSDLNIATSEESGITTLTGSFTDDPQTHEILVDWGDGATDVITLAQGVWTFDVTHEYTGGGGGGASVDDAVMEVEENTPNGTLVGTVTGTGGGAPTINVTVTDALGDTIDAELLGGGGPLTYSIIGGTGAT
ncbi:MAG: right-handed parallel beta-helix repeat-containing protein, partial [Pirellulales bacterium]|nr:right-handed parallel beta-helix repeat-containing protein [Pirellulales bacterium]